jgi:hypothetical protein
MGKHLGWRVLTVVLFAACGGDDDSSGGVVTGLPSEQKLSTLSDADVKKACQSVNDGASVVITPMAITRAFCMEGAAVSTVTYSSDGQATVDVDKCQQLLDACIESTKEGNSGDDVESDDEDDGVNDCEKSSANDLEGCEATVGEYEACINTVLSEMQRILSQLTCQNADKIESEEYSNDLDPTMMPECQKVMDKCPDNSLGIPFAN